ncbi:PREDICTED: uncharacterized protein LOC104719897 [Camelina sativa]|uniref:Uncharacterized protein LOC104719897 n=1 Tax=Camelina sativa TaxID=90675 RepID=A0ABM0U5N1_CAMSA|nr:PREDICTED: uncharacterized protein LOC104719897 [Camelina sativa]
MTSSGSSLLWRSRAPAPALPPRSQPLSKALSFPFSSALGGFIHRAPLSCSAEISSDSALVQSRPAPDFNPWSEFAQNVSGEWDGFGADFSRQGQPLELPESVVPEAYREWEVKVFDWQTQCPTLAQPDAHAFLYKSIKLLPTVGCEAYLSPSLFCISIFPSVDVTTASSHQNWALFISSSQGFVMNLQPSEAEAGFDIRIPPSVDAEALERRLVEEWAPASRNMSFEFKQKLTGKKFLTAADDSNPWWGLLENAVKEAGGRTSKPEIFPASTDARYFRKAGVPAFGFSPISNTPSLLHDHNEYLGKAEYLKGIDVYVSIIKAYASYESKSDSRDEL